MYVAVVIYQLEEALQYEVKEIMVTGTIASIVHESMYTRHTKENLNDKFGKRFANILDSLKINYVILNFTKTKKTTCLLLCRTPKNTDIMERIDCHSTGFN